VFARVATIFPAVATLALVAAFSRRATFACWNALSGRAAHLLIAFGHGGSAGEAHAALFVHAQALNPDFIPHFDDAYDQRSYQK
jgi:hypothetical protein